MSKVKKNLGKRIRELRTARNWTQEVLAEKIGIETASFLFNFDLKTQIQYSLNDNGP